MDEFSLGLFYIFLTEINAPLRTISRNDNERYLRSNNIMKNQRNYGYRKALTLALGLFAVITVEQKAEAQQFRTGVTVNWVPQPGKAYFNPAEQQYLIAMRHRQNAMSNLGTALNLNAARLYAQRQQIESVRRAQSSQMQSFQHYQNALRMRQQQSYQNYYQRQNQFNRRAGW